MLFLKGLKNDSFPLNGMVGLEFVGFQVVEFDLVRCEPPNFALNGQDVMTTSLMCS